MMAGSKEDAETVTAFFEDMKRRGLNDPLLVTSDVIAAGPLGQRKPLVAAPCERYGGGPCSAVCGGKVRAKNHSCPGVRLLKF
jgi:hypothetical protein